MEQVATELWIDDLRDPSKILPNFSDKVVWKKEAWEARNYLFRDAAPMLEVLYLDNNLGDADVSGEDLLSFVAFRLERYPNLKQVYLHSSDDVAIERMLSYKSHFDKANVALDVAPYRSRCL